jgi:hypothetical protein
MVRIGIMPAARIFRPRLFSGTGGFPPAPQPPQRSNRRACVKRSGGDAFAG